jgi:alpha-1,2-mannosyltransferase
MKSPTLNLRSLLTSRRLRVHGLLIGIVFWSTYAWIISVPGLHDRNGLLKGTDFLHHYVLGTLALENRGDLLYDMDAQAKVAAQRVPAAGRLVFLPLYGPQVSLFFAPLAGLPYGCALVLWLTGNTALYALCCYALWRTSPSLRTYRGITFILAAAYPAFVHLILWGQNSALALVCFTVAYLALRSQKFFWAGLAIGCLAFKPQLAVAALVIFLWTRQWKVLSGIAAATTSQLLIGWLYYGTAVMKDYAFRLLHVTEVYALLEPRPYQMHSLTSFWAALIPWPTVAFAFYVVTGVAVLTVSVRYWRSSAPLNLRYSVMLVATVLVSPHLTVYDLVILAPAFLLLADWAVAHADLPLAYAIGVLLYCAYVVPLTVPITQWTHVQISVPILASLLWLVSRSEVSKVTLPLATPVS